MISELRIMNINSLFILVFVGFLCIGTLGCRSEADKEKLKKDRPNTSIYEFLDRETEPLSIRLTSEFDTLLNNKESSAYQEARIQFKNQSGAEENFKIQIRTRGVTRKGFCDFPPLKLKFKKKEFAHRSLKLVTHCKADPKYEQYLLKEYLVYKMLNHLTEKSFRVKLLKLTYVDSDGSIPEQEKFAFLIENEEEMANRLEGELLEEEEKLTAIHKEQYALFTVFQCYIGNTDWNLGNRHNIKLVLSKNDSSPFPVPYDFDYSGLVNTHYALPHNSLPIKNVRDRMLQWRGKTIEGLKPYFETISAEHQSLLKIVDDFQFLNPEFKSDAVNYLNSFHELTGSDQAIRSLMRRKAN